jgi:opacity protein-like surface antigen
VAGTRIDLQVVPLAASLRFQLPALRPSPYLLVGGGAALIHATFDPPDFNATLRAGHAVGLLQAGAGLVVDLSDGVFLGLEARYLHLGDFNAFDTTLRLDGLAASAVFGVRR